MADKEKHDWQREDLYSRQKDIFNPLELATQVTIVGAGGIGSPVALALGKLGIPEITVYDDDKIERHNLPNQLYPMRRQCAIDLADDKSEEYESTLGEHKVHLLKEVVENWTEAKVEAISERSNGGPYRGIVISAVDSMKSRKEIFNGCKYKPTVKLFLDGRIGGEFIRVYAINPTDPDDVTFYEKTLYADDDADELPCTARAVIYVSFFVAAILCRAVAKFINDGERKREVVFDAKQLAVY